MPKSPDTSTITVNAAGQTSVTIPKPLAETLRLKSGQKLMWRILGKGRVEVSIQ